MGDAALDPDSHILARQEVTPANVYEGRRLPDLLEKNARRVTADKACESKHNHRLLNGSGTRSVTRI